MSDWDNLVEPTRGALEALLRKGDEMADRIEELEAKLAEADGALNICSASWGECNRILDETKAKLAVAVEELESMQKVPRSDASYGILMVMISYTLAELKGQKDE